MVSEDSESDKDYDIDSGVVMLSSTVTEKEFPDAFSKDASEIKSLSGLTSNTKRKITTMEKHFRGVDNAQSKQQEESYVTGYNAFEVISPPYNLNYLAKLYELSAPNYAAINAKTANIVGLGYDFVESNKTKRKFDNTDDQDRIKRMRKQLARAKDDLNDFIDTLNEEDTFTEILIKVWRDYETTGNGYIEIGRITTGPNKGQIGYVGHIPSTTIRVRRKRDGYVQIIADKAVFFRNFGDRKTSNPVGGDNNPNELIHIKKYAPTSTYYGLPDIIAAKQAVAGNEFAGRFNLDYFENKAVPRHIVILKGATINPQLAENILQFFETGLKGQNHRSLFVPLPADTNEKKVSFEFKPVEAGIQDSSFNNYRKGNLNEILMVHRVPITKVSVGEGVALAVARDADKTFKETVCQPEQRVFEKKINRIIVEFTDLFVLKLNEMTLTDENTQSQIDERRRKTGVETANEQRARRGQPGVEGGDELFDMNAAGKAAQQRAEDSANRQRDSQRSAGATDSVGEGRNAKGDGRATP